MIDCAAVDELRLLGRPLPAEAAGHARGCPRCCEQEAALATLARALRADVAPPPGLAARILVAATPLLAENALRAARWRFTRAIAAAVVPLPLIVAIDAWLVRTAYGLLSSFLPEAVSLWVVVNWIGMLALLLALTYGSIPFLVARQAPVLRPRSA